ncbi:hypothetical protein Agabi119p4_10002 [Agaricus bisporus var. burnettii]|uniref:3'-5' exonuclease n=1 Tax=Agaricus bisporus var. burnettii TaxID=192524 RepID=A0A8H7EXV1_AGABI|nr:hypothetical protein Agabi119p4_10002 [Agaricus bisporus var. burnettii]
MSMELTRPDIGTEGCSSAVVDSGLVQSFGGPSAPSHALLEESGARLDDQTTLALSSFPPASDEPLNQAVLRARGRPRIKPIIYGPKRRRGRPSGSGSKPKHQAKLRQRSPTIPHVSNPIIRDTLIPMPGTHRRGAFLQPVIAAQVVEPTEKDLETEATFSSPLQATYPIIQDEDPNSVIQDDVDASDEETNADGKGIGEDDDCDDIGPEDDGGSREGRKRRPLPGWLLDAFNERVEESKQRDAQGLPPLREKASVSLKSIQSEILSLGSPGVVPFNSLSSMRCVDMDNTFWIIGYRYQCAKCINQQSVTYRSWDSRILDALPPHLAAEFPAHLTHRSAMSKSLFEWMRLCFQNGMGSKQFSDSLRVRHLLSYDNLHLQYLYHLVSLRQGLQHWMDIKYETFLPFDDKSLRGRHGFVPGSEWLHDMYDTYIEGHQHNFNQHMAMLTGEVCAIDHSHKVTKQIARVDGEQVFTALLTVTNEKGEIRICNFVATKSHSQFETALTRMRRSLEQYGHSQPVLFYTDNMADKQFLENSFPSLRNDVIPIEEYSHLQPLVIPSEIRIMPMDTVQSINHAISTILDDVPVDTGEIAVGFDSEWNVELSPQGFVRCAGKTAVIQIAYKSRIYILQVSNMIAQGKLPQQLETFLSHPRDTLRPSQPFVEGVDLAKLAKERHLIKNISKCSLSDLSALVLQKRLTKNTPQRTSQAWENRTLTPEQLDYAAQDAYATLRVYEELITHYSIPTPIPPTVPLLTPVLVFGSDLTNVVAEGQVCLEQLGNIDGIRVAKHHLIVEVLRVHVPGAVITSHQKRSLDGFGTPPFKLVCLRSHLKLYSTPPIHQANQTTAPSYLIPPPSGPSHCYELLIHEHDGTSDGELEGQNEVISLQDSLSTDISGSTMNLAGYSVNSENADTEATTSSRIIGEIDSASSPSEWDYSIRSRVLKDPWHFFHMLYLPATHGLRKQFTQELRDGLFIPHDEDRRRINSWGAVQKPSKTYEELRNSSPSWIRARCRHTIPPPHILHLLVSKLFQTYGPLLDPITKQPLFSASTWKVAKNLLELIRKGFISDPSNIPLYTRIGTDKKNGGLPIYRCCRGTNATEGGVHTHIRSRLPKFGVSVRHVHASLLDFTLRHNLLTGVYNSTGQRYRGHFSIWVTNEIQELLISLQEMFIQPTLISGWVNEDIRGQSAMALYVHSANSQQKHSFIASMQGTRKPVLPVHTHAEEQYFRSLMNSDPSFSPQSGEPKWNEAIQVWNANAESRDGVYYKLVEQLKTYYSRWKAHLNVKEALSLTSEQRRPVTQMVHDPNRSRVVPPVSPRPLQPHHALTGFSEHEPSELHPPSFNTIPVSTDSMANYTQQIETRIQQWVATRLQKKTPIDKPRRPRTCKKCANPNCPGCNSHKLHLPCPYSEIASHMQG